MSWWIFIHSYLWRNSLRRWYEQPLSLISKLVISALLGILGAVVIMGITELGRQLDSRLNNRDVLTARILDSYSKSEALGRIKVGTSEAENWSKLASESVTIYQVPSFAETDLEKGISIIAAENLETFGLIDDFFIVSSAFNLGQKMEFEINQVRSEASVIRPTPEMEILLNGRTGLLAGVGRLSGLMAEGFNENTILRAKNLSELERVDAVVAALQQTEGRNIFFQSNLMILRELKKIRQIQSQALIWVTLLSGSILGLVFGSLAWMEFREERYLLALIRSFGVGRLSLLAHSLVENCLLSISGVLMGFGGLAFITSMLDLSTLKMSWLGSSASLFYGDGLFLLLGAGLGGLLSGIPIAIGLRKPLGLVLT